MHPVFQMKFLIALYGDANTPDLRQSEANFSVNISSVDFCVAIPHRFAHLKSDIGVTLRSLTLRQSLQYTVLGRVTT